MKISIRLPEEILAYRSLEAIIKRDTAEVWSVSPSDTALKAAQLMAEKDIGLVVVLDGDQLAGVLSERDCVRQGLATGKTLDAIPVSQIMVRDPVVVGLQHTFADCLRLMHAHGIRHLPVTRNNKVVAVISVRDLMAEAVEHHRRIISELERERLTIFTSMA